MRGNDRISRNRRIRAISLTLATLVLLATPGRGWGGAQAPASVREASAFEFFDWRLFSIPQVTGFTVVAAIDLVTGMVLSAANSVGIQDPALEDLDLDIRESICAVGGTMLGAISAVESWMDPESVPGRFTQEIRAWGQVYLETIEKAPSHRELRGPLSMQVGFENVSFVGLTNRALTIRL